MAKILAAGCLTARRGAADRLRAFAANGNFLSGMVPDGSEDRSRAAELESGHAGVAGTFSNCDARISFSQSPPREPELFTRPLHWQCHQRSIDDLGDDAVVHQGAELVAFPQTGCAEKRALEGRVPHLRALRVIRCNLLEIDVI